MNSLENFSPREWKGLAAGEADRRLRIYGPNRLKVEGIGDRLKEILKTLGDPMAIMLVLASVTYFLWGINGMAGYY